MTAKPSVWPKRAKTSRRLRPQAFHHGMSRRTTSGCQYKSEKVNSAAPASQSMNRYIHWRTAAGSLSGCRAAFSSAGGNFSRVWYHSRRAVVP
ncbi:hypothetical protein D3C78_1715660 [compost metagenome]